MLDLKQRTVGGIELLEVPGDKEGSHIIFFHGYGANAFDLLPLHRVYGEYPRPTWIFPHAPLKVRFSEEYEGKAWFPIDMTLLHEAFRENDFDKILQAFPPQIEEARKAGEHLIEELNIPLSNLFLGGFSQGAVLATEIALNAETSPGGLVILSGSLFNPHLWEELAPAHDGLSFFQSHGRRDPLLPFQSAVALNKLLVKAGWESHFHPFDGGHEIPSSILHSLQNYFRICLAS